MLLDCRSVSPSSLIRYVVIALIRSLLIFTEEGLPLFGWVPKGSIDEPSRHKDIVSGFLSAIRSVSQEVYRSHPQRIDFENTAIMMKGSLFPVPDAKDGRTSQMMIISTEVDSIDDRGLVASLLGKILNY